jgi:hypothetical protein
MTERRKALQGVAKCVTLIAEETDRGVAGSVDYQVGPAINMLCGLKCKVLTVKWVMRLVSIVLGWVRVVPYIKFSCFPSNVCISDKTVRVL